MAICTPSVRIPRNIVHERMYLKQAEFVFGSLEAADEQLRGFEYEIACDDWPAQSSYCREIQVPSGLLIQISIVVRANAIHVCGVAVALRRKLEARHVQSNY
jgi:hypothetical protein